MGVGVGLKIFFLGVRKNYSVLATPLENVDSISLNLLMNRNRM